MSEASSGEIQACASQVKIEEIDEASTDDGQFFMTEVEVKGEVTTSSDWRYYIQQVVIEESGKASVSDCQAYESHTKFENTMETSSNDRCYYMQHVIEESEEAVASDPLSNINPVKIEEGMEAFRHGGQQDMETEGVEEASPNDHHTSMTHIKLEAEEAAFSSFQYHIELAGIEEGENASASDREVCLGLVKTEDVSATDSQDLVRQVMAEERDEAPAVDQVACLWHIKVEDEKACAIDKQACMTHIKIEEEDVSIDEQACMRHIKIEDEACAIGQQACMRPPMFGKDETHANEEQTCVRRLKIEEQMHAPDQQASVSQVKMEEGDECPIGQEMCMDEVKTKEEYEAISGTKWQNVIDHRLMKEGEETPTNYTLQCPTNPVMSDEGQQTSAQDMGLAERAEMEVEEGTSSVYYQNAIVQLMPGKEGETMAKNGHYLLVTLAITGGSTTSAREQQNLLTQVEMQREESFVGELKGFVGHSNIRNKADTLTKGLQVPREFAQEEDPRGSSIKDSVRPNKGEQREEGPAKDTHDPSDPCKIQEKQDPPCMVFHHPMNQEVADEEQHTPWHLDEYTVYMDVEEGKEQLVFHDPLVQEGHMLSASPYNRSTVQEYQLPLSDDHDPMSHEDDDVSSSNEHDLQFQDGEELSDWEYLDWRNFVSNDTKGDPQATADENTTNQQSQSPPSERELSDADSLCFSDKEQQPGPSGLPGRTPSRGLIVPTTTTTTINTPATTTTLTPATATCAAATSTITTTACNTVPGSVATNTTTHAEDAGDSVRVRQQPIPQVCVSRAGGRATGGQSHEDTETEALATVARVLGAYQQNQGQMGQVVEELRELRLLQRSMGTRMGQLVDLMGQLVGGLRDMYAAQMTAQPTSSGQPAETHTTSAAATEMGELQDNNSSDTSEPAAEAPPAKRKRGRPRNTAGGSRGKAPTKAKSLSQP